MAYGVFPEIGFFLQHVSHAGDHRTVRTLVSPFLTRPAPNNSSVCVHFSYFMSGPEDELAVLSISGRSATGGEDIIWLVRTIPDGQWHEAEGVITTTHKQLVIRMSGARHKAGLRDIRLRGCHLCEL